MRKYVSTSPASAQLKHRMHRRNFNYKNVNLNPSLLLASTLTIIHHILSPAIVLILPTKIQVEFIQSIFEYIVWRIIMLFKCLVQKLVGVCELAQMQWMIFSKFASCNGGFKLILFWFYIHRRNFFSTFSLLRWCIDGETGRFNMHAVFGVLSYMTGFITALNTLIIYHV